MKSSGRRKLRVPGRGKKDFLAFLPLLPGLGLILYYILGPAEGYFSSDCADSLLWAEATLRSGHLIARNFHYAALLPFGGNLIFLPFAALFGYSLAAQKAGLVLFAILFAGAVWYVAKGLKLGRSAAGGMVSLTLLILSAGVKLREIMWEHIFYYNLGILFFCLGFGLLLRIREDSRAAEDDPRAARRLKRRCALLFILTVLIATDGLQALICYSLPLAFALLSERFTEEKTPPKKEARISWLVLLLILAGSAAGFILIKPLSGGANAGYADAYSSFSALSAWGDNFRKVLPNWFRLLGVSVPETQSFYRLSSVLLALRIGLSLGLLGLPFILLLKRSSLPDRGLRFLLSGHLAVSAGILFAVIFGRLGGAEWRLAPMLGTAVLSSLAAAFAFLKEKGLPRRKGLAIACCLLLLAALPAAEIAQMPADYERDDAWHTAAAVLKEKGLQKGYASFWWSEKISMIAGEAVDLTLIGLEEGYPTKKTYQCFYDAYASGDGQPCFLLLSEQERKSTDAWLRAQEEAEAVTDSFEIVTKPYERFGFSGDRLYVFVFPDNPL